MSRNVRWCEYLFIYLKQNYPSPQHSNAWRKTKIPHYIKSRITKKKLWERSIGRSGVPVIYDSKLFMIQEKYLRIMKKYYISFSLAMALVDGDGTRVRLSDNWEQVVWNFLLFLFFLERREKFQNEGGVVAMVLETWIVDINIFSWTFFFKIFSMGANLKVDLFKNWRPIYVILF